MINDVLRLLNDRSLTAAELKLTPAYLAEAIRLVEAGTINTSTGKALVHKVQDTGKAPKTIVEEEGLAKVSDTGAIRAICAEILAANPGQVATYKSGKTTLIGWFVGQVMRASRGKADPETTRALLEELLAA